MTEQETIRLELTREEAEVEYVTCARCGGVGEERLHDYSGHGSYFWEECPACNGEGSVPVIVEQLREAGNGE